MSQDMYNVMFQDDRLRLLYIMMFQDDGAMFDASPEAGISPWSQIPPGNFWDNTNYQDTPSEGINGKVK